MRQFQLRPDLDEGRSLTLKPVQTTIRASAVEGSEQHSFRVLVQECNRYWHHAMERLLAGVKMSDLGVSPFDPDYVDGSTHLLRVIGEEIGCHLSVVHPEPPEGLTDLGLVEVVVPVYGDFLHWDVEVIELPFWLISVGSSGAAAAAAAAAGPAGGMAAAIAAAVANRARGLPPGSRGGDRPSTEVQSGPGWTKVKVKGDGPWSVYAKGKSGAGFDESWEAKEKHTPEVGVEFKFGKKRKDKDDANRIIWIPPWVLGVQDLWALQRTVVDGMKTLSVERTDVSLVGRLPFQWSGTPR